MAATVVRSSPSGIEQARDLTAGVSPLFPHLGIGVGLRPFYLERFLSTPPRSVSWVEVVTENFLPWESGLNGRPLQILERVRRNLPVALHGVSLSIGSAEELNWSYLKRLKTLADRIEPAWISDHLCWTGIDGENLHDLLPLPYTEEALFWVVDRLKRVQDFLGRRILVENVSSYLSFTQSEIPEWEFVREVCERADCGLLLDVNNVYVNSVNHGFDPGVYLDALSARRVGQIHLAGHTPAPESAFVGGVGGRSGLLIDSHDAPVCEEVWALYEFCVRKFGRVTAMVERDGNFPAWEELESELGRVREIWGGRESAEHLERSRLETAGLKAPNEIVKPGFASGVGNSRVRA